MATSWVLACAFVISSAVAVDVPDFLHICKKNDPHLEECMTKSVEFLRPYLEKGVPEYNIPSLEPLVLKELVASEGSVIRISAKNVLAHGASNFYVRKLRVDLNLLRFAVDIDLPHLYIEGMYEIEGRVLLLPITGSGPMYGNFTDASGAARLQGEIVKDVDGDEHLQFNEFNMKISIGKGNLKLDNLFGGEKVLGDAINSAINSNFDAFIKELRPLIEKALSDAFLEIGNNIVKPFTFQQLFPES